MEYYLQEIASYGDPLKLRDLRDIRDRAPTAVPENKWRQWTQYDRLGAMPADVAPERFYQNSSLDSVAALGDFSAAYDSAIKLVSRRFVAALVERGQPDLQVFPLTFRVEGTPPDDDASLALHCFAKIDIFDFEASTIKRINPWAYGKPLSNPYDDGNPDPPIYAPTWTRLQLEREIDPARLKLPPLFGLKGVRHSLFVSPDFADFMVSNGWLVELAKRLLNYDRTLGGERPLGCETI